MSLKLSPLMKAMVLDGGFPSLDGGVFPFPPGMELANGDSVTVTVTSVDNEGVTVRFDAPVRFTLVAEVRCPKCGKKLGESLQGTYTTTCPRCKERVTITR